MRDQREWSDSVACGGSSTLRGLQEKGVHAFAVRRGPPGKGVCLRERRARRLSPVRPLPGCGEFVPAEREEGVEAPCGAAASASSAVVSPGKLALGAGAAAHVRSGRVEPWSRRTSRLSTAECPSDRRPDGAAVSDSAATIATAGFDTLSLGVSRAAVRVARSLHGVTRRTVRASRG